MELPPVGLDWRSRVPVPRHFRPASLLPHSAPSRPGPPSAEATGPVRSALGRGSMSHRLATLGTRGAKGSSSRPVCVSPGAWSLHRPAPQPGLPSPWPGCRHTLLGASPHAARGGREMTPRTVPGPCRAGPVSRPLSPGSPRQASAWSQPWRCLVKWKDGQSVGAAGSGSRSQLSARL